MYILGDAPSEIEAKQIGIDMVEVSWTAPSVPPPRYRITATSNNTSAVFKAVASPHNITVSTSGVYSIHVTSLSEHLPGRTVELHGFTVAGEENLYCVIVCVGIIPSCVYAVHGDVVMPEVVIVHVNYHSQSVPVA